VSKGNDLLLTPLLERLRPLLVNEAQPVYIVGGTVRDAILGREIHDIDLAVAANAIALTFRLANELDLPAYVLDGDRDVGRIIVPDESITLDVARFRGPTLKDDLRGRDFTINALALPAGGQRVADVIDLHNGLDDLEAGRVRIIHSHSIFEDPVRALRAARFAVQLGFSLTADTMAAARDAGPILPERASAERVRDELSRLLTSGAPHRGLALLDELELLAVVLPEIAALDGVAQSPPHHQDVLAHTLTVLRYLVQIERLVDGLSLAAEWREAVETLVAPHRAGLIAHLEQMTDGGSKGRLLLMWGGLLHDVGKRNTQTIDSNGRIRFIGHDEAGAAIAGKLASAFGFSNEAARRIRSIVAGHMRPLYLAAERQSPSRRSAYRYFRTLHEAGLDVGLLALADHLATYDGIGDSQSWESLLLVIGSLFNTYFGDYERTIAPPRLLDGRAVMELLGVPPGHEIGRLLRMLEEAQAAGEISTQAEAVEFIRHHHTA
jgi:putative nucleotidyltransferase with HDIG domain